MKNLFKKNSNKNDLKYTLDKLYKCRDLEISNLWQRSVFLSVFLILCFTAYGYIGIELLKVVDICYNNSFKLTILNIAAMLILSVGIIFSIIWIMMSKASKAWYEVYETAITEFEKKNFSKLGLPEENIMGMMKFPQNQRCDSIFSTNGGAFSPSKINIFIGQVSLYLLVILGLTHLIIIQIVMNNRVFGILSILIFIITLTLSIILLHSKKVKSGFLRES